MKRKWTYDHELRCAFELVDDDEQCAIRLTHLVPNQGGGSIEDRVQWFREAVEHLHWFIGRLSNPQIVRHLQNHAMDLYAEERTSPFGRATREQRLRAVENAVPMERPARSFDDCVPYDPDAEPS